LHSIITYAYENIPFYKNLYDHYKINIGKLNLPEDLRHLPIIEKEDFQKHYEAFFPYRLNSSFAKIFNRFDIEATSGTTGIPLRIAKDRQKSAYIRATMFRFYSIYGISIGEKQARFWGVPVKRTDRLKEKFKDLCANRIRISAFALYNENFSRIYESILSFKPKYFYGYPSVIYEFAKWIDDNLGSQQPPIESLKCIITTGEILYEHHRQLMKRIFGCPVINEYGSTEFGVIAFECPRGKMHINADHVFVETIPSKWTGINEIVITELNNFFNPLIRYRLGDMGSVRQGGCNCGWTFPILEEIAGRTRSFIVTPDGRSVNHVVLGYTLRKGIKNFKGIQISKNLVKINFVRDKDFSERLLSKYERRLRKFLGNQIQIIFEEVDNIERTKSGKYAYFESLIDQGV
jgi:phenylacetate-CoA ligase